MFALRREPKLMFRRLRGLRPQYDTVGRHRIRLPVGSQVLDHKRRFRLYDTALGSIASMIHAKYPDLHAIDIGANVGDTAALIRKSADIPVLCIEGDPLLVPVLLDNSARLGH